MLRNKNYRVAAAVVLSAGLTVGLSACNSSAVSFLKSTSIAVTQIGTDEYLKLTSVFDLGNVSLAAATIGIKDPSTGLEAGQIDFTQLANGQSQISLSANTSLIPKSSAALGMDLPNGNPIPAVLGATAGDVLGIQILDHSVLYVGGSTATTAYVGVALGLAGFDSVMNNLSVSLNLFFVGTWNNVIGVGGIYGSNTVANESGIAIFGKYTNPSSVVAAKSLARVGAKAVTPAATLPDNDYAIEKLNAYNTNKLAKFFYGKKRVLHVN